MDKMPVSLDELIAGLKACNQTKNCNECFLNGTQFCHTTIINMAIEALEELYRKEKFHAFIWNALGHHNMMELVNAYNEKENKDNGKDNASTEHLRPGQALCVREAPGHQPQPLQAVP